MSINLATIKNCGPLMLTDTNFADDTADHLCAWLDDAAFERAPFPHWRLQNILPHSLINALLALPFAPPDSPVFAGQREANHSTRVYFTPANQSRFSAIHDTAAAFANPAVIARLAALTGADLAGTKLRIEYCLDTDGFWLEPHCDIAVKRFTMLIYLSPDPALFDAGTDIYDAGPAYARVATIPYEQNAGLVFIPAHNTWHGVSRRPISGIRKTLIINYVGPDWRADGELA